MSLTIEWSKRIDHWLRTMPSLLYTPLADVPLEGFETAEQHTPEVAAQGTFRFMPTGTAWGPKWSYAWFRASVRLPAAAAGQRIVFKGETGGESLAFVDGRVAGAIDWAHPYLTLTRKARAGARFELLIESYGGHGDTPCGGGPVPHAVQSVPEPGLTQRTVGHSSVGIWNEELYQLFMDVQTLRKLRDVLPAASLRVQEIDAGLRDFTCLCDLELPRAALLASCRKARQRLAPLLACVNGTTSPHLTCFGHAHIDVAWLWPLQETERKCGRTFSTTAALMDEYPEYQFLQSQAHLYQMTRARYPELYARIRAAVRKGQWLPEGAMWVEADTNVTGGESLIRQCLHGKRFFREEFGIDNELLWLPDVFGYSGALPQILKGCGIQYFSTQKIFWNYNGGENFPYNTFWWEGIDGTRLLSHFHNDYNSHTSPTEVNDRWAGRAQKDGIRTRLMPFGYGDGGGGPTRDHLEYLRRERNLEGLPRTSIGSPLEFFREQARDAAHLPVYVGELYFQCHRGTYTTQARNKRGNRVCELALREAELWACAAWDRPGYSYPQAVMDTAWKGVLLNQFHDIIPGSSIARVYDESRALYAEVEVAAGATRLAATAALVAPDPDALTVFNSLSWPRRARVLLPESFAGATCDGQPLAVQRLDGRLCAELPAVPACGWTTVVAAPALPAVSAAATLKAAARSLENACLRARFNASGELVSLWDKEIGRELLAGPSNQFRMFKDVPSWFDAWDIDSTYQATPVALASAARITVESRGPLVAVLRIERTLNESCLVQRVSLARDSRRLDFETTIEWQERHKLLKVAFTPDLHANEALHEIQFGHLARPNHSSRQFDADRFEVSMHKWSALVEQARGAAVLNDSKYGCSVEGPTISLTLLRSPLSPDMTADLGTQRFTYSFYAWNGSFADSDVIRQAYDLNVPVVTAAGRGGTGTLVGVDQPDIIVEAVKPAEDGSGDTIVRLYESKRTTTACTVQLHRPFRKVLATDMLEQGGQPLAVRDGAVALDFRPFEIKTLRLVR